MTYEELRPGDVTRRDLELLLRLTEVSADGTAEGRLRRFAAGTLRWLRVVHREAWGLWLVSVLVRDEGRVLWVEGAYGEAGLAKFPKLRMELLRAFARAEGCGRVEASTTVRGPNGIEEALRRMRGLAPGATPHSLVYSYEVL